MAQHIPIESFKQKIFKKIKERITKDIKGSHPRGSLKYDWDDETSIFYRENENEEVCLCMRYIGRGFVLGDNRGIFEIHFDKNTREIKQIYLVA